ncbi:ATP-binding protein [uncultured Thomasclavelia sp.]|uniref:ATP-binding protein n=1 Tax=uncultured Thomasclavelia sp. TaxID=3025759 RepID=UPI0025CD0BFA|nr:ATP-binding protein [uncultured Thomasclavelia sp.]
MQEIAMNILDIAYNSIRAGATMIKVLITDSLKQNIIEIKIIDNGKGMDKETLTKVTDPFYTTRTTRKVGLGIPIFKENIEATGGHFDIESTVNIGTSVTGIFVKDHLDTPPMGNIVDTMVTLIQADEKINYIFEYNTDDFNFTLDTCQIKEILGNDVSITEPQIIMWLKDYMKEGLHS